jgi:hypothetical protein
MTGLTKILNRVEHPFFQREHECCGARPLFLFYDKPSYEGKSTKYKVLDACLLPARAALGGEEYRFGLDDAKNVMIDNKGPIIRNLFLRIVCGILAIALLPLTIVAIFIWEHSWDKQKKELFDSLVQRGLNIPKPKPDLTHQYLLGEMRENGKVLHKLTSKEVKS